MRMPTSCAQGTSVSRANSWEAPTASPRRSSDDPDGLRLAGVRPTASGSMGAPGATTAAPFPPVSTTLNFDPEEAALKRAEVILPPALSPNLPAPTRVHPRAGRRERLSRELARGHRDHRLAAAGRPRARDGVHRVQHGRRAAGADRDAPGAGGRAARRRWSSWRRPDSNTFASNPDLPVRSFTLAFDAGGRTRCSPDPGPLRRGNRPHDERQAGRPQRQGVERSSRSSPRPAATRARRCPCDGAASSPRSWRG